MKYQSFNLVISTVDGFNNKIGKEYILNKLRYDSLNTICELVDSIVSENDCIEVGAFVDESTKQLTIYANCYDITLDKYNENTNNFFLLTKLINSLSFSKVNDDIMKVSFNVEDLWEVSHG